MNHEDFISNLVDNRIPVSVFLVNGLRMSGTVTYWDGYSMLLTKDGGTQLIFKHAIATVLPNS